MLIMQAVILSLKKKKKKKKNYARSSKLCQKLRKYNLFVLYNKELKYTGKKF